MTRVSKKNWAVSAIAFLLVLGVSGAASAQEEERGTSALELPRRGYEARTIRLGDWVVEPMVEAQAAYDDNVFATSTNKDDDFVYTVRPSIELTATQAKLKAVVDAYTRIRGFADNESEDSVTFGGGIAANYAISRANRLTGNFRYDRSVQSRTDPEASPVFLSPRKIDSTVAELGYRYQRNRLGFGIDGSAQRLNYLNLSDQDRDQVSYRGSLKVSLQASPRFDTYVQGFVTRRDARLAFDRSGVDRDSTTVGVFAGTSIDIGSRWSGEVGAGYFRANPDGRDPGTLVPLESFSGFGANGSLRWSPRARTAITASVFRGDVATIRSGASGRIDTRFGLRLDQEIRHNLLFSANAGVRRTTYRGITRRLTSKSVGGEFEYLLNGQISLVANANYTDRSASDPLQEFEKLVVGIGTKLRY